MKTIEDVKSMFPMDVEITQNMIKEGRKNLGDTTQCIGARLLRKYVRGNNIETDWGAWTGGISIIDGDSFRVTTPDNINMMYVTEPFKTQLILV